MCCVFRFSFFFLVALLLMVVVVLSVQMGKEEGGSVVVEHEGLSTYYQARIEEYELTVQNKTQNLRRLEAQRNELNTKGNSVRLCTALVARLSRAMVPWSCVILTMCLLRARVCHAVQSASCAMSCHC